MTDERRGIARGPGGKLGEDDWGERSNFAVIFEEQPRARPEKLCEEERAIRYRRRRLIQDRLDLIGAADLVRRGGVASPPEGLAEGWAPVLLGGRRHGGGVS
jgi:hypothetical protein